MKWLAFHRRATFRMACGYLWIAITVWPDSAMAVSMCGQRNFSGTTVEECYDAADSYATFSNSCGTQRLDAQAASNGAVPTNIVPCPRGGASPDGGFADRGEQRHREAATAEFQLGNGSFAMKDYLSAQVHYEAAENEARESGDVESERVYKQNKLLARCDGLLTRFYNNAAMLHEARGDGDHIPSLKEEEIGPCRDFPQQMAWLDKQIPLLEEAQRRAVQEFEARQAKAAREAQEQKEAQAEREQREAEEAAAAKKQKEVDEAEAAKEQQEAEAAREQKEAAERVAAEKERVRVASVEQLKRAIPALPGQNPFNGANVAGPTANEPSRNPDTDTARSTDNPFRSSLPQGRGHPLWLGDKDKCASASALEKGTAAWFDVCGGSQQKNQNGGSRPGFMAANPFTQPNPSPETPSNNTTAAVSLYSDCDNDDELPGSLFVRGRVEFFCTHTDWDHFRDPARGTAIKFVAVACGRADEPMLAEHHASARAAHLIFGAKLARGGFDAFVIDGDKDVCKRTK